MSLLIFLLLYISKKYKFAFVNFNTYVKNRMGYYVPKDDLGNGENDNEGNGGGNDQFIDPSA